ncbi:MAG: class I SAM-dependent methyltransferase [Chloroflexota bacterium]|nr:class I SAM-dependent methyltransferase [Chloroflexota bacterium]
MPALILKKGREKAILRKHPWIFSGAVARVDGDPEPGETVVVRDSKEHYLATAAYSPQSQIRARIWSWDEEQSINQDFFDARLRAALALRKQQINTDHTDAYRLIHAESDRLPGLVVDRYSDALVLQILSAGAEHWRDTIVSALVDLLHPTCIYERSDVAVRKLEGLAERTGTLYGNSDGLPDSLQENGLKYKIDLLGGQKTGFYLDQRDNRQICREVAKGKKVLNCFAYTGGFTLSALAGGAKSVLSIDSSADALDLARENVALNGLPEDKCEWLVGDVFEELRTLRDKAEQFDLIILDPPKFAPTASQARKAARGYKDINLYGFKLLKPGGTLMTFSCSGGIDAAFFQKIIADAALDAGVDAQIVARLSQAADHPTLLSFPEGSYLKGLEIIS